MEDLIKGLYKQSNISKNPPSTWVFARNIVVGRQLKSVSNEQGFVTFTNIGDLEGTIIGYITLNVSIVIFTELGGEGIIGIYSESGYEVLLRSTGLNFNINNPIRGDFIYNFKKEVTISFWDGLADNANYPRILNIDCLPFEVDVNKRPININDLILLKLFADVGCTDIVLKSVQEGGGVWDTGAHYFTKAYVLSDNSVTNYTPLTNPVFIIADIVSNPYSQIDGGAAGTNTTKSIELTFNNLDIRYKKIRIACVSRIGGILSAFTFPDRSITATTFTTILSRTEDITEQSIGSILVPDATYSRVQTGVFISNRLTLANVKQETVDDYQPYANNITTKWVRDQEINIGTYEGSYKDPMVLFDKKGFAADEVYAFVVAFGLKDGTTSQWFHIPGRAEGLIGLGAFTDTALVSDIDAAYPLTPNYEEALLVANDGKYFQFFNSAKVTGEMGFWENADETYADTDCSDIKDVTGVIGTLRNVNIRHHKFPTYERLNAWGSPFAEVSPSTVSTQNIFEWIGDSSNDGRNPWGFGTSNVGSLDYDFSINTKQIIDTAYFVINPSPYHLKLDVQQDCDVIIKLDLNFSSHSIMDFTFEIRLGSSTGELAENIDINLAGGILDRVEERLDRTFRYKLYAGSTIFVKWTRNSTLDAPYLKNNKSIKIILSSFKEITTTTKAMGVKFENIYIPPEIQDKVVCQYFGYLQRDLQNNSKITTTLLDRNPKALEPEKDFRIRDFDLGHNQPQLQCDYIKSFLVYETPAPTFPATIYDVSGIYGVFLVTIPQTYVEDLRAVSKSEYQLLVDFLQDGKTITGSEFSISTTNNYNTFSDPKFGLGTMVSLFMYRTNLYFDYPSDKVVIMGVNPITSGVYTDNRLLYSGDVHMNYITLQHGVQLYPTIISPPSLEEFFVIQKSYVTENVTNSEMRYTTEDRFYAPRVVGEIGTLPFFKYHTGIAIRYTNEGYSIPTWDLYNIDYTSVNDITPQLIFSCNTDCLTYVDTFPYRIARSLKSANEDGTAQWRTFKLNDYYDMLNKDKGDIKLISKYGGSLIIHQEYSTYLALSKDIITTTSSDLYIGKADIFDRPPKELVVSESSDAYAGCQSLWGGKLTKNGYVFWDLLAGKVFIFSGEIKELSSEGLKYFFEQKSQLVDKTIDNPFIDKGICIGFDEKENRLLFTKTDAVGSFTISYSFHLKKWICNHDYLPNAYVNNRLGTFCLRSTGTNSGGTAFPAVYKTNVENKYGTYFTNTVYPSYIDVVLLSNSLVKFIGVVWESEVYGNNFNMTERLFDETITQVMCYDNYRCTGLIDLKNNKNIINDNLRKVLNNWLFNDIRDIVINKDNVTIFEDGSINLANLNTNTLFFKKSKFINNFIVVRLQYDNIAQRGIDIKNMTVTATKSDR